MLIPVTHPTQCIAECAKCGVQRTSEHDLGSIHGVQWSIFLWLCLWSFWCSPWPSKFHRSIRTHNTLANHRTYNTRPHCHFDWGMGMGCAMAAECWVWAKEKPYFSYVEIHVLTRGIRKQKHFTRNDQQETAASARAVKALIMNTWL